MPTPLFGIYHLSLVGSVPEGHYVLKVKSRSSRKPQALDSRAFGPAGLPVGRNQAFDKSDVLS